MEALRIAWIGAIGAGSLVTLLVAIFFYQQEGRVRVYLASFLFAEAFQGATSLVTVLGSGSDLSLGPWFVLPRIVAWLLVAATGGALVLYQLGVLNGHSPVR